MRAITVWSSRRTAPRLRWELPPTQAIKSSTSLTRPKPGPQADLGTKIVKTCQNHSRPNGIMWFGWKRLDCIIMSSCCVTIAFAQGPVQMSAQRTKSMPLTFFLWSVGNVVALTRHMGEGCFLTSKFKQFKLENGCQMVAKWLPNGRQFYPILPLQRFEQMMSKSLSLQPTFDFARVSAFRWNATA